MEIDIISCRGFSQIFPSNGTELHIEGFINVLDEEFYISLHIVSRCHPKKINMKGSWRLCHLLMPVMAILEQRLSACDTLEDMMQELTILVEKELKPNKTGSSLISPSSIYYQLILNHLGELGWERVHYANQSMDMIKLKATDDHHREHILTLKLKNSYPETEPIFCCDLPEEFIFKWTPKKTLSSVYDHFQNCVKKYCEFWNWMDDIDLNTWVLEPENPSRKSCKRRIALASTASLLIVVNPTSPSSMPLCHYLGPERIVEPLRKTFNRNIDKWDEQSSLLCNLRNALEIEFPSPLTSKKEEFFIECGICYAHLLEDALPNIICNDSKCNQLYHHICLYEWLKSLSTAKQSFSNIFGTCPYCSKPISCTIPDMSK